MEPNIIKSENHQLYTYTVSKIAFCNYDDKRWLRSDGILMLMDTMKQNKKYSISK